MQYELLSYLKCPITKTELRFELISEFEKPYADSTITEINEGLLFSETGFVFPILNGIPRMLLESIYDYADFLKKHLPGYEKLKDSLEKNNKGILNYCVTKNKKTKASFEFEWSFLNAEKKDRIWQEDIAGLSSVFSKEVGERLEYFSGKNIIDVGCGSGYMTSAIAGVSKLAIGVELSRSVENAFRNNKTHNAWYIQGDLQFLPFQRSAFDVLYSSGVIHHTNDTEQSLSLIETVLKNNGKICLWLYHPQKSKIHNFILFLRRFTKRMPLKLCFVFLVVFVFPFTYLIKRIKNKKAPNYREEMIDLLDGFTPEFRFEIPHDMAISWLTQRKYNNIKITSENQFGFSIAGYKPTDR